MDVLHHAFSLSACPKCHLLICKHTSLANLDFHTLEDDGRGNDSDEQNEGERRMIKKNGTHPHQRLSSHGMNFYLLPPTLANSQYSWTTFGSQFLSSTSTLKPDKSETDNIPLANENLLPISPTMKPNMTQIVRTQSERYPKHVATPFYLTKSFSFSTISTLSPKLIKASMLRPRLEPKQHVSPLRQCSLNLSHLRLVLLMICYLLTNTFDLVLLYIYYHTNRFALILFTCVLLICDLSLWMNHLMAYRTVPARLLLVPFAIRFYLLYHLVESLIRCCHQHTIVDREMFEASSTPSSSTTTTLETNLSRTSKDPLISSSSRQTTNHRLFDHFILFTFTHSSLIVLINLYLWSINFQTTVTSFLTMDYFLPRWITDKDRLSLEFEPHLTSSSVFVLITIVYHLFCLSIIPHVATRSCSMLISIFSRLCLIISRLYTLIFLIRLHAWWFTLTFVIIHYTFMITLLIDRSMVIVDRSGIVLKFILSLMTLISLESSSVHALISLENIFIFLHRLYLETFALPNDTTLHLIIFIAILTSIQIIGFLLAMLSTTMDLPSEKDKTIITAL